ncbi:MAG: sulfatase-like hydrolase/transferase, partial [Roseibacillus sp.]|nr:sulfatase-like hydrolase/transferase [Roseibacillus sp.]
MKPLGPAIRLFFAGILLGNVHAGTEEPYNVLLIISDDLNSRIAPLGDVDAITPNLTRLAARTVNYRNCLSQYPFCAPSRGSFLTGLFPWNLGIHAAGGTTANGENVVPNRMWMSQYFRSEGY